MFKFTMCDLTVAFFFVVSLLAGCSTNPARNEPLLGESSISVPRADMTVWSSDEAQRPFIGVAISGGGSRAAVFGWSVLQKLEELGVMAEADSISSVSGGSLAAAFYALNVDDLQTPQDWDAKRDQLSFNFLHEWLGRLLNPVNIIRMSTTGFNRTQLMSEVLDDHLFEHKRFADLGNLASGRPILLINGTSAIDPTKSRGFVFDASTFSGKLASRLDTFPVSQAVMASGAFPGVFGSIPLRSYNERFIVTGTNKEIPVDLHEQVYDGGASDNLGIWTLVHRARSLYKASVQQGTPMRACLFVIVDAYAPDYGQQMNALSASSDMSVVDLLVKPTAWASIDGLLNANRLKSLQALGLNPDFRGGAASTDRYVPVPTLRHNEALGGTLLDWNWRRSYEPLSRFPLFGPQLPWVGAEVWAPVDKSITDTKDWSNDRVAALHRLRIEKTASLEANAPECLVWHITFDRLESMQDYVFRDGSKFTFASADPTNAIRRDYEQNFKIDDRTRLNQLVETLTPIEPPEAAQAASLIREIHAINYSRLSLRTMTTSIGTSYQLAGPEGCGTNQIKEGLDVAATVLVKEDQVSSGKVCDWLRSQGLSEHCSLPVVSNKNVDRSGTPWTAGVAKTTRGREVPIFKCGAPPSAAEIDSLVKSLRTRGVPGADLIPWPPSPQN